MEIETGYDVVIDINKFMSELSYWALQNSCAAKERNSMTVANAHKEMIDFIKQYMGETNVGN